MLYSFLVFGLANAGAEIQKGPYLIYPGNPTQMTVLWQLDFTGTCRLEWGLDTSHSVGSVLTTQYGTDHQHKYTIGTSTPLTPGTKYFYRVEVEVGSGDYYTGTFLTAPGANAEDVKFLAYGDTRTDQASHNNVCAGIVSTYTGDPNYQTFLVHVGDWVNTGDSELSWATEFFSRSPLYPSIKELQANLPLQGCVGNHEFYGNGFKKYWPYPYVADRYWSFDYGPVHVVIVDQYVDYGPGSAQLTWVEDDLSASMKDWKIIVLHEPGWSAGGGHGNNGWVQRYIQPLCERYGVDIIFCGHNHYYARADVMGVQHITTGGGGAPLHTPHPSYPFVVAAARTYEFCKIDIRGHELTFEAVKPDGTIIDRFVLLCEPVLVVEIDIKPGSYPNAINLGSHGLTPVAIFSMVGFDATSVDPNTVNLAGAAVAMRGKDKFMAHKEDANGDELVDLVVQVAIDDLREFLESNQDAFGHVVLPLTGSTYDGEAIEGEDEIIIVPPK